MIDLDYAPCRSLCCYLWLWCCYKWVWDSRSCQLKVLELFLHLFKFYSLLFVYVIKLVNQRLYIMDICDAGATNFWRAIFCRKHERVPSWCLEQAHKSFGTDEDFLLVTFIYKLNTVHFVYDVGSNCIADLPFMTTRLFMVLAVTAVQISLDRVGDQGDPLGLFSLWRRHCLRREGIETRLRLIVLSGKWCCLDWFLVHFISCTYSFHLYRAVYIPSHACSASLHLVIFAKWCYIFYVILSIII